MIPEDDLKRYLPKYLSAENYEMLLQELRAFPDNIDDRMYTFSLEQNILFQGDGLKELPFVDIVNFGKGVKNIPCLVLSNTCDMDIANRRLFPAAMMYTPIVNLERHIQVLRDKGVTDDAIKNHISDIKKQKSTQIMFLPKNKNIEDSIIFLDRILHIDCRSVNRDTLKEQRLFSLSDYGFYLLIFKLSVHFSRIQEKVDRRA